MSFVLNIPNALTLLRMALVPAFVALFFTGHYIWGLATYIVASVTDVLDGYLARRLNQVTSFGKLMDPLADKLMQLMMLVCLGAGGYAPWWALIVLAGKELLMVLGGAFLLKRKVVVRAFWPGKAATALLVAAVLALYPWHHWAWLTTAGQILLWAGVGMSLWAMIYYFHYYFIRKEGRG